MVLTIVLLLALAPDPAPQAIAEEITVIGKRLQDWRGVIRTKKRVAQCSTRRSTGDAAIDAIGCDAMLTCWPRFEPEFRALAADPVDRATRETRNAEVGQRMAMCVGDRNDALVAELADRRSGRRPDSEDAAQ